MSEPFVPIHPDQIDLTWPEDLTHISASSLGMALRCSEQWRQRYVLGKKAPPNFAMVAGTADHKAIARNFAHKIETTQDLPQGEVVSHFMELLEGSVEEMGGIGEFDTQGKDPVAVWDETRTLGEKAVAAYHEVACPKIQPISVEEEFSIEIPGIQVPLIGYIDLRTTTRMIDRKTARRAPRDLQPEWRFQAQVYQLRHAQPFDWHVTVKQRFPDVILGGSHLTLDVGPPERTMRMLSQLVSGIGFLYQRYGPDEPWPTNGVFHSWACSYCGWRKDCVAWK